MKNKKIELSPSEKKELKKMYGWYMSIRSEDFDSHEDFVAERKDVVKEYESKFPNLASAKISILDLPELIYSKNQLKFINDAADSWLKVDYSYSGRGMFGDCCPSVHCNNHNDFKTKANTVMDQMGLGIVIYAQY